MGYDLTGETGNEFRLCIGWWNDMWEYICKYGMRKKILTQEIFEKGNYNSNETINTKEVLISVNECLDSLEMFKKFLQNSGDYFSID